MTSSVQCQGFLGPEAGEVRVKGLGGWTCGVAPVPFPGPFETFLSLQSRVNEDANDDIQLLIPIIEAIEVL